MAILLCSYPCSPLFFFPEHVAGKAYKSQQLWQRVSYASFWLLTEMEVCPCPCFGLGSRLCAEFMALVHFRLVTATLQPLSLPVTAVLSPSPLPGHLYQKHLERGSKFMEALLNGQHILVELSSLHILSSASSHIRPQDRTHSYGHVN